MIETAKQKRKREHRNIVIDWLSYAGLRVLIFVLGLFSIERNLKTACGLGRILWKYYTRGRKRALDNLRASFPGETEEWYLKTAKRSFEHMSMLAIDVMFAPKLVRRDNVKEYSYYKNVEYARWLMHEGNGMLMVGAHYSNFEILSYILSVFDFNVYSIARPLDNKFISNYLYGKRKKAGQKIIDKKGASAIMHAITDEGATLCFVADQDAGRRGVFVDFFGRKASTYKSIALLAITNNIPIGVGYSRRVENRFYFEIGINRIIFPEEWADKDDPILWVTAEYTRAIEDFVREDPSQYWWLHRRWKHRPKDEKPAEQKK